MYIYIYIYIYSPNKRRHDYAPGGMRGGPGDSRFELKLSLHSSDTVAPAGVAGLTTPAAHHRPPPPRKALKTLILKMGTLFFMPPGGLWRAWGAAPEASWGPLGRILGPKASPKTTQRTQTCH